MISKAGKITGLALGFAATVMELTGCANSGLATKAATTVDEAVGQSRYAYAVFAAVLDSYGRPVIVGGVPKVDSSGHPVMDSKGQPVIVGGLPKLEVFATCLPAGSGTFCILASNGQTIFVPSDAVVNVAMITSILTSSGNAALGTGVLLSGVSSLAHPYTPGNSYSTSVSGGCGVNVDSPYAGANPGNGATLNPTGNGTTQTLTQPCATTGNGNNSPYATTHANQYINPYGYTTGGVQLQSFQYSPETMDKLRVDPTARSGDFGSIDRSPYDSSSVYGSPSRKDLSGNYRIQSYKFNGLEI